MDYQALLAALLVVFTLTAALAMLCYTPLPLKNDWEGQPAKWLRVVGLVFGFSFGILGLCHESIGASETRRFARIIVNCNVYLVQTASLLEATRGDSRPDVRTYLYVVVSSFLVLLFNTASIVMTALSYRTQALPALARWLPPIFATCIQLAIMALLAWRLAWRLKLGTATAATYCWFSSIYAFTHLLSIVPLWISVAIRQERELPVLGCQVSQLVLLNWPLAFLPPVLLQIYVGPKEDKKAFLSRVKWPWESVPAPKEIDEVGLTGSSSPIASSVWTTAPDEAAKVVSPEATRAW